MIAATALILLAEAAAACPPVAIGRLGGGAMFVQPVAIFEQPPFEHLGPTTDVRSKPEGIQQTGATTSDDDAEVAEPAEQCAAVSSPIV